MPQQLVEAAERRADVAAALASVRTEGLEPTIQGLALLEAVVDGQVSTKQAREQILVRYRRR